MGLEYKLYQYWETIRGDGEGICGCGYFVENSKVTNQPFFSVCLFLEGSCTDQWCK